MPSRSLRPCLRVGCPELVAGGYCEAHGSAADPRESAARRGYGRAWERLRRIKLRQTPQCERPGCRELATDVHHREAVRRTGRVLVAVEDLESLCHAHHSQITVRGG